MYPEQWQIILLPGAGVLAAFLLAAGVIFAIGRRMADQALDRILVRLLKDPYPENLWELLIGMTRMPPHILFDLEMRAETGELLERPLGSVVRITHLEGISFNPAQIVRSPLAPLSPVDTSVSIGPRSLHPLKIDIPIIVGAISYGIAINKPFALALAGGSNIAGTAYNAGSGVVLPEIIDRADKLILQITGGPLPSAESLARADMLEIRLGHGSRASLGRAIPAVALSQEARQALGMNKDETLIHQVPVPGAGSPEDLQMLVPMLREATGGKPVGVKIAATNDIEEEVSIAIAAGVDFITLDGSEGGTHASPPIISDDFGIPCIYALQRAVTLLEQTGKRQEISILAGGGLRTPGEMLKALAFGADIAVIGTAAMMAATHGQLSKAAPFEPITGMVWANSRLAGRFDPGKGAKTLANFLRASAEEMAEAARALGKSSIQEINREDLIASTPEAAELFNLPACWLPRFR